MTTRTSHESITFMRPFSLAGIDGVQPAGTYTVETHEELLQGISFPAYRRISTLMFLPLRAGGAFVEQAIEIDPVELKAAQKRDAAGAGEGDEGAAPVLGASFIGSGT